MKFIRKYLLVALALPFLVSFCINSLAQDSSKSYFDNYTGDVKVPPEPKKQYADFVAAIAKDNPKTALAAFCLPVVALQQ